MLSIFRLLGALNATEHKDELVNKNFNISRIHKTVLITVKFSAIS